MRPLPHALEVSPTGVFRVFRVGAVCLLWTACPGPVSAADPAEEVSSQAAVISGPPVQSGGMFLPAENTVHLWRQTLATVAADWPLDRVQEPDLQAMPPRPGVIESVWVEPPVAPSTIGATGLPVASEDSPRRQRVVVRMVPTVGGAWIDAVVETEYLSNLGFVGPDSRVSLTAAWDTGRFNAAETDVTTRLAARLAPMEEPVYALPPPRNDRLLHTPEPPWAHSRFPRLSRAGHKVWQDYRSFYSCDSLTCITAAFGAGALMANTGFDTTMQNAWMTGVEPTSLGTFFLGCKDIGEGRYSLPIFGVAAATGLVLEGQPVGDALGGWGSRSLRMFVVGAPPLYVLQWATGSSRPNDNSSAGSDWSFFNDNNGVSGHAFVGAIPFLAAADMVESPLLKGTLYVCSTFVGFSRMTSDAHYPSQVFLGWYLAWASSMAVSRTETHFAGMEVRVVPLPTADLGGMGVEARW